MSAEPNSDDWAVVTIAREPPEVIRRFVSWHLAMGAARIRIYFDDPADPMIAGVSHLPQVEAVPCTPEFWDRIGFVSDHRFVKRQVAAIRHGYAETKLPWIVVLDADELIWVRETTFSAFLAQRAPSIRSVLFRPAERVYVPNLGRHMLRTEMQEDTIQAVYGKLQKAMIGRRGLYGHVVGKSVHRAGIAGMEVRQHFGQFNRKEHIIDELIDWQTGGGVIHLMNNSYENWRGKLEFRRISSSTSRRLTRILSDAIDSGEEGRIKAIYRKIFEVDQESFGLMSEDGALHELPFDPDHAVERYFPGAMKT